MKDLEGRITRLRARRSKFQREARKLTVEIHALNKQLEQRKKAVPNPRPSPPAVHSRQAKRSSRSSSDTEDPMGNGHGV